MNIVCESPYPQYSGTGYCIDQNNNKACDYDGGDCCLPTGNTEYCTLCICHEDCDAPMELIGNGVCDNEANNVDCKYDDGDCETTTTPGGGTTICLKKYVGLNYSASIIGRYNKECLALF